MSITRASLALLLVLAAATQADAQDWSWRKAVPAGKAVEIKGVNGNIEARAASGNQVEVRARKTAKRSDPDDVKIEVVEHAGGVTICAMYPTPRGDRENECLPGAHGRSNTRDNDVVVDFEVLVPRGVLFTGRTVNGNIEATGLTADVDVQTVNGNVDVETTGLAEAATVNGSIEARLGRANWTDTRSFQTVNGGITIELPGDLHADVSASTVNGSLSSDWPMTISGKWGPRKMRGKIGNGGRGLELQTVNGDIELKRIN